MGPARFGTVLLALGLFALLLLVSGCDELDSVVEQGNTWLVASGVVPSGKPGAAPSGTAHATPQASPAPGQANLELLSEIFRVVFLRDPVSPSERRVLVGLVDALNQGASLEGLYNGLTHSADYRRLETERRGASPATLNAFGELLSHMEAELPEPAHFDASAAQPLATPVEPAYRKLAPEEASASPKPPKPQEAHAATPEEMAAWARDYSTVFVGASFYTLKRVMGDEALRVVAAHDSTREKLALWYSKWAVQMAGLGIDFGLALRNSTDENFHYKWALSMPEDRVKWEVLNRVHRILNQSAGGAPKGTR